MPAKKNRWESVMGGGHLGKFPIVVYQKRKWKDHYVVSLSDV